MTTEELMALGPDLTNVLTLRRVRLLLAGNRLLKDALSSSGDPAASVLSSLMNYLYDQAEKLETTPPDQLMPSTIIAELTELVLVLHSMVITHPRIVMEHEPRRFTTSIILLMQTRNYDLTLSCLRLFKALFSHCLPDSDPTMRQVAIEIMSATSDLFCDQKLVKLFIMSMMKNSLVKELILGILAGLTCSNEQITAAVGTGGQLENYCSIRSLLSTGSSERTCFFTLTCYYNLILLSCAARSEEDKASNSMTDTAPTLSELTPKHVKELPAQLMECPESLETLSLLHNAEYSVRVRCMAVTTLLRLYIIFPEKFEEHRLSYVPRLLQGFVRLAEIMTHAPKGLGELGRLAFRDMAVCIYSMSSSMVTLVSYCNHMCTLIDSIEAPDDEWRIILNGVLSAFSLRLESVRLQVASLTAPQRLLKDYSADVARRRLVADMTFIFALSRSVEVLRSLLVDHPTLVDTTVAVIRQARTALDFDVLCLAIKLLTNLALPVAGALHLRFVERQVARLLAEIVRARSELPLGPRLYALTALTNLALSPDASDVVASSVKSSLGNLDGGSSVSRQDRGAGGVTLRSPLPPSALIELLEEANDLTSPRQRQQLAACVAQFTRNLMGVEDTFEDDDDEEDEDEEDDKDDSRVQLENLAKAFLHIISSPSTTFGFIAKEAALLALSSVAASRRQISMPLSVDWANQLISNFIRDSQTASCQLAAMLAINYLDDLNLPWRRRIRQEVATAEVAQAMRSEGARFLREKFLTETFREEDMATMSGSESS